MRRSNYLKASDIYRVTAVYCMMARPYAADHAPWFSLPHDAMRKSVLDSRWRRTTKFGVAWGIGIGVIHPTAVAQFRRARFVNASWVSY